MRKKKKTKKERERARERQKVVGNSVTNRTSISNMESFFFETIVNRVDKYKRYDGGDQLISAGGSRIVKCSLYTETGGAP